MRKKIRESGACLLQKMNQATGKFIYIAKGFSKYRKTLAVCFLVLIFCFTTVTAAFSAGVSKKSSKSDIDIEFETKDGFLIHGKLSLPKEKRAKYPLVVLLHSIGYSSKYWLDMPSQFNQAGFAVLAVDFRGHGSSTYDKNFKKKYWLYMSEKSYLEYPSDILSLIQYMGENYKNISISHMVIVGADIGANTAVLVADKMKVKPKAIVLLSPSTKFKGLYIPISLANLGSTPILVGISGKDKYSISQANYLKRFAQGEFTIKAYPNGGIGILMLKVNPGMNVDIVNWVVKKYNAIATPIPAPAASKKPKK